MGYPNLRQVWFFALSKQYRPLHPKLCAPDLAAKHDPNPPLPLGWSRRLQHFPHTDEPSTPSPAKKQVVAPGLAMGKYRATHPVWHVSQTALLHMAKSLPISHAILSKCPAIRKRHWNHCRRNAQEKDRPLWIYWVPTRDHPWGSSAPTLAELGTCRARNEWARIFAKCYNNTTNELTQKTSNTTHHVP